jgi:hypothetical protein
MAKPNDLIVVMFRCVSKRFGLCANVLVAHAKDAKMTALRGACAKRSMNFRPTEVTP